MGTTFDEIYDLALVTMQDYKIDELYQLDRPTFKTFMKGFLVTGLPEFDVNLEDLSYTDETFNNIISDKAKLILSEIIVYEWYKRNNNDVLVYKPKLTSKQFKQIEISSGIKQRSEYLDKMYEKIRYDISQYQLMNFNKLPFFGGLM